MRALSFRECCCSSWRRSITARLSVIKSVSLSYKLIVRGIQIKEKKEKSCRSRMKVGEKNPSAFPLFSSYIISSTSLPCSSVSSFLLSIVIRSYGSPSSVSLLGGKPPWSPRTYPSWLTPRLRRCGVQIPHGLNGGEKERRGRRGREEKGEEGKEGPPSLA